MEAQAAISGAGDRPREAGQAGGNGVGLRRRWRVSARRLKTWRGEGQGRGCRAVPAPGPALPLAARSRSGALGLLPPRRSLVFPPRSPAALQRGRGGPEGVGQEAGGGGGGPGDRGSGGTELLHRALLSSLAGDSAEGGGSKGRCGAPRPPWAQAPPLSTARGVAGGQGRGRGAEWRPAHPAPHSRAEGSDKGEGAFQAPAQVSTSYSRGCGMGEGSWPASPGVTP